MEIGMKAPTLRIPCLLNGKLNFLSLSAFQGSTVALCCVSSLTETAAWVLDAQVKRFQECGTVLAVLVSGDFPFEPNWIRSSYNFWPPLLADPLKRVSRVLRLSRSLPPQQCETLFFDDHSRLTFRLIHDLNLRGISTVLDIAESEFYQRSSHAPLEAACRSNSFQRESCILALSTTEPLVLPGEIIRVFIQKEGQGFEQGIAHLDDGTMVVIDHGASLVGQTIDVEVTRFMQTNTGRMIFAIHESHEPALARNQVSFPQHIPSHVSI